jgi:hypothetical protein
MQAYGGVEVDTLTLHSGGQCCILELPDSSLGQHIDYPDWSFRGSDHL